jgi:hypothetical protein
LPDAGGRVFRQADQRQHEYVKGITEAGHALKLVSILDLAIEAGR